ncbi:MAG: GNAT family N-acetyltransferase [Planctomycetia bacterium]|nr:GNAT family N-acetyltransferase [Planctomycetia bacterium]
MAITYYKRFRMEVDLNRAKLPEPELPGEYECVAWHESLLERHALAKYESFRSEIDTEVFPSLGDPTSCRNLMSEIVQRATFVPQATWLIRCILGDGVSEDCGTIQGLIQAGEWGAIQNVGVAPEHRGRGLGRALVLKSLAGFQTAGVSRVYLEVTARNAVAVQLYRSVGFRLARTTYKAVDRPTAMYAVL